MIEVLYPDPNDYSDNERFFYWMDYACELDEITNVAYIESERLAEYLNMRMGKLKKDTPQHDAYVDTASNLEENVAEYKGVFVYE
jgi:hypothetical protein